MFQAYIIVTIINVNKMIASIKYLPTKTVTGGPSAFTALLLFTVGGGCRNCLNWGPADT